MRVLGVDFGERRVGLAVSDPSGSLAFPLRTVHRTTRKALFEELAALIEAEGVEALVVGLPLGLDGQETLTTRQAKNFAASLAGRTGLPVHLADERLSSALAEEDLKAAGRRRLGKDGRLDMQAAVRILQSWLDNRPEKGDIDGP